MTQPISTFPSPRDPSQVLGLVPLKNLAIRIERKSEGAVVWIPIQRTRLMEGPLGWFLPFRKEKGFALDSLGREVLEACDGERTVERIVEQFADRHRIRFHEARASVLMFLRLLVERKIVVFALGPTEPA